MFEGLFQSKNDFQNKRLCKKCKGKCCSYSPCILESSDMDMSSPESIVKDIKDKKLSMIPVINEDFYFTNEFFTFPYLYVRGASRYSKPVDLYSMNGPCVHLTEKGCDFSYEDRPSGGKLLIPEKDHKCHYEHDLVTFNLVVSFLPFQDDLREAASIMTGTSVIDEAESLFKSFSDRIYDIDEYGIKTMMHGFINSYTYVKLANEYGLQRYSPKALSNLERTLKRFPGREKEIIEYVRTHFHSKEVENFDLDTIILRNL